MKVRVVSTGQPSEEALASIGGIILGAFERIEALPHDAYPARLRETDAKKPRESQMRHPSVNVFALCDDWDETEEGTTLTGPAPSRLAIGEGPLLPDGRMPDDVQLDLWLVAQLYAPEGEWAPSSVRIVFSMPDGHESILTEQQIAHVPLSGLWTHRQQFGILTNLVGTYLGKLYVNGELLAQCPLWVRYAFR